MALWPKLLLKSQAFEPPCDPQPGILFFPRRAIAYLGQTGRSLCSSALLSSALLSWPPLPRLEKKRSRCSFGFSKTKNDACRIFVTGKTNGFSLWSFLFLKSLLFHWSNLFLEKQKGRELLVADPCCFGPLFDADAFFLVFLRGGRFRYTTTFLEKYQIGHKSLLVLRCDF